MSESNIRKLAKDVLYAGFGPWFLIGVWAVAGVALVLRLVGAL